jgi:hypothetical protein
MAVPLNRGCQALRVVTGYRNRGQDERREERRVKDRHLHSCPPWRSRPRCQPGRSAATSRARPRKRRSGSWSYCRGGGVIWSLTVSTGASAAFRVPISIATQVSWSGLVRRSCPAGRDRRSKPRSDSRWYRSPARPSRRCRSGWSPPPVPAFPSTTSPSPLAPGYRCFRRRWSPPRSGYRRSLAWSRTSRSARSRSPR